MARVRALLGAAVFASLALLLPSLAGAEPARAVLAVAILLAVCATLVLARGLCRPAPRLLPMQSRTADEDRCLRTGRPTDPVHSPLRPRAPGLV